MKTIGIFCHGQIGDCGTITSALRYRQELWGDAKLVWFIADENRDILAHQDIELRTFPRGFGHPELTITENKKLTDVGKEPIWEDWKPLVDENNHLNLELKKNYLSLSGIDYGYFPAPHQMGVEKRHGIPYDLVAKKVLGIPDNYEWHPVISHSDEEKFKVYEYMANIGASGKRIILFETFAGSDQSKITHEMVIESIRICKEKWKGCIIVFVSHKYLKSQEQFPEGFFEQEGIYSAAHFSVRQCALLTHYSHLMISVSSGVTVACSAWNMNPIPIAQFCGSKICSTAALALGRFELITYDDKTFENAKNEFYEKLKLLLNERNT